MSGYATSTDHIPDQFRVFGTMLRPFSLGHHLLLVKVGSPFANFFFSSKVAEQRELAIKTARACRPDDLALAVFICASRYQESIDSIIRGEWTNEFNRWMRMIRPRRWSRRSRFLHNIEAEAFALYLCEGYRKPPVWKHDGVGIELSSPWEYLLKCKLVQSGFSEAEVMEKPLPVAWYDYFTLSEMHQAESCVKVENWKKVFFTRQDFEAWNSSSR